MTVVAFTLSRFTPADMAEFNALAAPKLQRGLWAGVERQSGSGYDRISVRFPGLDRPVFSFERDQRGAYNLKYHDRTGSHIIGQGDTAAECLSVWKPRRSSDQETARMA